VRRSHGSLTLATFSCSCSRNEAHIGSLDHGNRLAGLEPLFLHGERSIELDTPEIKRTVFVLPEWLTKNKEARVVVLNDVAQRIIDGVRDQHPAYVFTWMDRKGRRPRFTRLNNSGWKAARRRAAARYPEELGRAAPEEFRHVRVHDAPEIGISLRR